MVTLPIVVGRRTDHIGLLWVECPSCGVRGEVAGAGTATCGYCGYDFDVVDQRDVA